MLRHAKARLGELVRKALSEGPQHVIVHEHGEVVVIAAEDFCRLTGDVTGRDLTDAAPMPPHRDY